MRRSSYLYVNVDGRHSIRARVYRTQGNTESLGWRLLYYSRAGSPAELRIVVWSTASFLVVALGPAHANSLFRLEMFSKPVHCLRSRHGCAVGTSNQDEPRGIELLQSGSCHRLARKPDPDVSVTNDVV